MIRAYPFRRNAMVMGCVAVSQNKNGRHRVRKARQ
jgi:hypothetical protein